MDTLHIRHLTRRYHLQTQQRDWVPLLDQTLEFAFGYHLETALSCAAGTEEEICVRQLRVPLRFLSGRSQEDIARNWSALIDDAIRRAIAGGGDNLVRFPSRWHALLDFALEVSRGRLQRTWAWNQTGWADLSATAGLPEARRQLWEAMLREHARLVPVLIFLARRGHLCDLLQGFSADARITLLHYALLGAGAGPEWLAADADTAAQGAPGAAPVPDLALTAIGGALLADPQRARSLGVPERYWLLLALLEEEPGLFLRRAPDIAWRLRVARAALAPVAAPAPGRAAGAAMENRGAARRQAVAAEPPQRDRPSAPDPGVAVAEGVAPSADPKPVGRLPEPADRVPDASPMVTTAPAAAFTADFAAWVYDSRWGGLFYLLPLLEQQPGALASLAGAVPLAGRSLAWSLHHLLRLCAARADDPLPADDPALRILCNEDLDQPPPEYAVPDVAAQALLELEAMQLLERVYAHLPARTATAGWSWLCRRRAQLRLDGAWLEVVFALADADTDIRRAGLDLDPGYVPWLAKVVKLRYE